MKIVNVALTALAVSVPLLASAQTATPGIDQRQINQERRIEQGERSGQLTPNEAARLERGQTHVDRMEDRAKADGTVTRQERNRIHQAQDVQSRRIYREKHDAQQAERPVPRHRSHSGFGAPAKRQPGN